MQFFIESEVVFSQQGEGQPQFCLVYLAHRIQYGLYHLDDYTPGELGSDRCLGKIIYDGSGNCLEFSSL